MDRATPRIWKTLPWLLLAGVGLVALSWPLIVGYLRAAILLDRLNDNRVTRLQHLLVGPVVSTQVDIQTSVGPVHGHLYRRVRGSNQRGIVMVHGFAPLGDSYPELVGAADNLAASGFVVFTPTIPPLTHYIVNSDGMKMIGDSVSWLAKQTGGPVTGIGISFSGGLLMVSAVQPEYRSNFRQIVLLSPYDDLKRIIYFYLTGREATPQGQMLPDSGPNPFAVDVTALQFLPFLVPSQDVSPVRSALQRAIALEQTSSPRDPHLTDGMTEQQRKETADIVAAQADLKSRLSDVLLGRSTDLDALSPHGQLSSLDVPVTIITGKNDFAIPSMETTWLAHDLPPRTVCRVYLSPLISHVLMIPDRSTTVADSARRWMYKVLLLNALAPAMRAADPHLLFRGCSVS